MPNYSLPNGQKMWIGSFTGEVVDGNEWTHNSVSQNLNEYTVTNHQNQKFWLRSPDGKEREFQFTDANIQARAGHKLTVIWGATEGTDTGPNLAVIQHTTGQTFITSHTTDTVIRAGVITKWGFFRKLIALGLCFTIIGIPLVAFWFVVDAIRVKGAQKQLKNFTAQVVSEIKPSLNPQLSTASV